MDPITMLTAFAPMVMDLGKSLISKFIAPDVFKPATIEQYTQMKTLDLEFFKTMKVLLIKKVTILKFLISSPIPKITCCCI